MPLTAAQLLDFRGDMGLPANPGVFTDTELQRFFERSGSYYGAVVLSIHQLLMDAAKRNDYAAGQTRENSKQVFDMLLKMRDKFEELQKLEEGQEVTQIVGLRSVPTTTNVETPYGERSLAWRKRRL